jgi:hypothetical protein
MYTKWEILEQRAEDFEKRAQTIRNYLEGLTKTPTGNIKCAGCELVIGTEEEFAKHFVIPNGHYLNLGDCPVVRPNHVNRDTINVLER